jgi:CHAT domain-containing protein/tetratricopeptide (TPR) repeat protein
MNPPEPNRDYERLVESILFLPSTAEIRAAVQSFARLKADDLRAALDSRGRSFREEGRYEELELLEFVRAELADFLSANSGNENNLLEVKQLALHIMELNQQGRFEEMRRLAQKGLEVARQHLGEDSPFVLVHLHNLAEAERNLGNPAAAESLYCQALDMVRASEGERSPVFARIAGNLALLYKQTKRYAETEPLYRQSLEVIRAALGEEHPAYAQGLNNLAMLHQAQGNYAAAEPLFRHALKIWQAVHGAEHPETLTGLDNLARLLHDQGDIAGAESLLRQALEVRRGMPRIPPKELGDNLINLASVRRDFLEVDPLEQEALGILRRGLGENHPYVAATLNGLGAEHFKAGRYGPAEAVLRQALAAHLATVGENDPDTAQVLNNLGMVFLETRNLAAAEQHFRRAFGIRQATLGEDHPDTVDSNAALARIYKEIGRPVEAIEIYRRCLEVQRQALGEDHPTVGALKNDLAAAYIAAGDPAAAEPLFREAVATLHVHQAKDDPRYGAALNNLARLYHKRGDHAAAEPLLRESLAAREAAHGEDHPYVAVSLGDLADLCAATGRFTEALTLLTRILAIEDRAIGLAFAGSPEGHRLATVKRFRWGMHAFLSLVVQHFANDPTAVGSALDLVLRRKALSTEAAAVQQEAALGSRYPELEVRFRELGEVRERLARATLAGPGPAPLEEHRRRLQELRERRDALEAELSRQVPEIRLERQLRAANRREVAAALPEGSALIEFACFGLRDFRASQWGLDRYVAFVLPAAEPDGVRLLDLGVAQDIDRLVAGFRAAVTREAQGRVRRDVVRTGAGDGPPPDAADGARLRAAVFDPLVAALGGRTHLLLTPDAGLNQLPFVVLPLGHEQRLIDGYCISYLGTGRDVLRFGTRPATLATEPLVIADPDFELSTEHASSTPPAVMPSRVSRDLKGADLHFNRLPGTRGEGEQVAALLEGRALLGADALEGRLKASPSPAVLHLATHGFFLEDHVSQILAGADEALAKWAAFEFLASGFPNSQSPQYPIASKDVREALADILLPETAGRFAARELENPLLRSGLALAGANTWLHGGSPPADAEDGLLTAENVEALDLRGTQLVVLSACDTGLGEVHTGEGVFGLRRAFIVAGARTLVVSLWKVPDEQTRELMIDFYTRVLQGQGVADGLRDAQQAMREKHPDPYYWGAFICQGDPGPLSLSCRKRPSVSCPAIPSIEAE